ncbi:MAG: peptidoglycan DD-metalloendopeptidase family protein [Chloroflexi bacterium]|nr:peptidoglycan DD-metalloendopeptidase family protein [Chloroflexota bacterium]
MQLRRLVAATALVAALLNAAGQPVFGAASPSPSPSPSPTPVTRGPRIYKLPYAGGLGFDVCQGNNHAGGTHTGVAAYAWDFCMDVGTPVVAARDGTVRAVRQDSNVGGWGPQFADDANFIVIDHGDGTSGLYMHLMQRGARVKVGDQVQTGQLIAYSGNTGWTSAPHLHFMVMQTEADNYYSQSLPVLFTDVPTDGGLPLEDHTYTSGNAKLDPRFFNPQGPPPFTPFWVETYRDSSLWSGTDENAVKFGPMAPWQFFQVLAPQSGPRLQVVAAATGAMAFIPAADVGPSGPPPSAAPATLSALPEKSSTVAPAPVAGSTRTVTVTAGDTLFSLAKAHQLTVDQIVALNHLADPDHIAAGQVLKLS